MAQNMLVTSRNFKNLLSFAEVGLIKRPKNREKK